MTHYQYLFCASCGLRRTGHGYRCTVCNSLLRRPGTPHPVHVSLPLDLQPLIRNAQDRSNGASAPVRQPVAA
jgi:hypothetical protein